MELIVELVAELLLQIFGELILGLGVRSIGAALSSKPAQSPLLAMLGYLLLGAGFGALSLAFFPHSFVTNPSWRWVSLFGTPALAGAAMASVGALRRRDERVALRIESFGFAFCFAFAISLVRFVVTAP